MNKFKVGDKVRISALGREVYMDDVSNPHNQEGVVTETWSVRSFVMWRNGVVNNYDPDDIEPVHKFKFEVGKTYKTVKQGEFTCIYVNVEGYAWLKSGPTSTAYVWDSNGKTVSFLTYNQYDIVFGPTIERKTVTVDYIDGVPDWDSAKLLTD